MNRNKKRNHIDSLMKSSTNNNTKPVWDALNVSKPNSKEIDIDLSCDALNNHFMSIAKSLIIVKDQLEYMTILLSNYCHVSLNLHIWI